MYLWMTITNIGRKTCTTEALGEEYKTAASVSSKETTAAVRSGNMVPDIY